MTTAILGVEVAAYRIFSVVAALLLLAVALVAGGGLARSCGCRLEALGHRGETISNLLEIHAWLVAAKPPCVFLHTVFIPHGAEFCRREGPSVRCVHRAAVVACGGTMPMDGLQTEICWDCMVPGGPVVFSGQHEVSELDD